VDQIWQTEPRILNLPVPELVAIFSDTAWRCPFDSTHTANGCLTWRSQNANRHVGDLEQRNAGDPKLFAALFQSPLIKWSHLKRLYQSEVTAMHFALNTEQACVQKTSVFRFIPLNTKAPTDKMCAAWTPSKSLTSCCRTCLQRPGVVYLISSTDFV